jgi:hypothetical protein
MRQTKPNEEILGNAVAQICNLLYRRFSIGGMNDFLWRIGGRTRSGMQFRDTAECNSAIRPPESPLKNVAFACLSTS